MNVVVDFVVGRYQRGLLSGIIDYFSAFPEVALYVPNFNFACREVPRRVDGILGVHFREPYLLKLVETGIPAVNLSSVSQQGIPQVCCDNSRIAQLAYDHFYGSGIKEMGFLHTRRFAVSAPRLDAMERICSKNRIALHVLTLEKKRQTGRRFMIVKELQASPKPIGILLPSDELAGPVIECCKELGLKIPDDVQVIGVNNDLGTCLASEPALTSIDIQPERIGYEAASMLLKFMKGEKVQAPALMPPGELVPRGTTSQQTKYSPAVNNAINFMHANLSEKIEMEDVLATQPFARRALEKLFSEEVGCPPMQYLRSVRFQHIQFMLKTTDLTVKEIGSRCGIPNITYLCRLFQRSYGMTPQQYRENPRE